MLRLGTAAVVLLVLLASCGGGDKKGDGGGSPSAGKAGADLTVTVRPSGASGPVRRRRIVCAELGPKAAEPQCRRLAGLSAEQLAPVPANTACTQIYGGPATARVQGTLRGKPVDARFERTDGCQIERWDRNRTLLGDAPSGAGAP